MRQIIYSIVAAVWQRQPISPQKVCAMEGHLMWPRLTGAPMQPRQYVEPRAGDPFRHLTEEWNNRPRFHAKACLRCGWDNVVDPMLDSLGGAGKP